MQKLPSQIAIQNQILAWRKKLLRLQEFKKILKKLSRIDKEVSLK